MILAFLPPNIEVHLCCRCSHSSTSRSVSSLRRFDVYNHSQPWTPHERQQPLAIIGCCRSEPGRGWGWGSLKYRKRKRGRSGEEWRWNNKGDEALLVVIPISRSRLIVRPVCVVYSSSNTLPSSTLPPFPTVSPFLPYILIVPTVPEIIGKTETEIDLEVSECLVLSGELERNVSVLKNATE